MDVPAMVARITARLEGLPRRDAGSLRKLRREITPEIATEKARQVLELAVQLFQSRTPGGTAVACELILYHRSALAAVRAADLERLGANMSSWGEVDTFAGVAGPAWRNGQISDRTVASWARSPSRWWRRAALVSTVPLNVKAQGGTGDAARTLAVCSILVDDRDPMVVKAMSWALRALSVRDPEAVRSFLQKNETGLATLVKREVRNKLDTGRKAGRRKSSAAADGQRQHA
jgi:3-methyladenine DNA glycosylase AlkD